MTKLFHAVYMVLWSQALVVCITRLESGDFGMLHIAGVVMSSMCAGFQLFDLLTEVIKGE